MPTWAACHDIAGTKFRVNLDHVRYMNRTEKKTTVMWMAGADGFLEVVETPGEILKGAGATDFSD